MFYIGVVGNLLWSGIFLTFIALKCYVNEVTANESQLGHHLTRLFFVSNEKLQVQAKSFYLSLCYEKYSHWPLALFQFDRKLLFSVSKFIFFFLLIKIHSSSILIVTSGDRLIHCRFDTI